MSTRSEDWTITCYTERTEPFIGYMIYLPTSQFKNDPVDVGVVPYSKPGPGVTMNSAPITKQVKTFSIDLEKNKVTIADVKAPKEVVIEPTVKKKSGGFVGASLDVQLEKNRIRYTPSSIRGMAINPTKRTKRGGFVGKRIVF